MSKQEKLVKKLLLLHNDFTYNEMVTLLMGLGYILEQRGKSSGSAIMFYNEKSNDKIRFHKPHPQKELKQYVLKLIIEHLKDKKLI